MLTHIHVLCSTEINNKMAYLFLPYHKYKNSSSKSHCLCVFLFYIVCKINSRFLHILTQTWLFHLWVRFMCRYTQMSKVYYFLPSTLGCKTWINMLYAFVTATLYKKHLLNTFFYSSETFKNVKLNKKKLNNHCIYYYFMLYV